MTFPIPIFVACKRRIFLAKIVCIPPEGYSKWQIYLSFTIVVIEELFTRMVERGHSVTYFKRKGHYISGHRFSAGQGT